MTEVVCGGCGVTYQRPTPPTPPPGTVPACPSCFAASQSVPRAELPLVLTMMRFNRIRGCRCSFLDVERNETTVMGPHWTITHNNPHCRVPRAAVARYN